MPMTPTFATHYRKGFTAPERWENFRRAVVAGDIAGINLAIACEGMVRRPVDAAVFATKSKDLDLANGFLPGPEVNTPPLDAEAQFVMTLAGLRDQPLAAAPVSWPEGLRVASWFLDGHMVQEYQPGTDFMASGPTFDAVYAGDPPTESLTIVGTSPILTGRHAASYVHTDDPILQWAGVVRKLLQHGAPYRVEPRLGGTSIACMGQSPFTAWGYPFLAGMMGETLLRLGLVSFRHKWKALIPRPEQYHLDRFAVYLPQAYPEGSPMHPARPAMHSAWALAMAECLATIFDENHTLPSGRTVGQELRLFADNIGMWRLWAGVHYLSDHTSAVTFSRALGRRVAMEHLK